MAKARYVSGKALFKVAKPVYVNGFNFVVNVSVHQPENMHIIEELHFAVDASLVVVKYY